MCPLAAGQPPSCIARHGQQQRRPGSRAVASCLRPSLFRGATNSLDAPGSLVTPLPVWESGATEGRASQCRVQTAAQPAVLSSVWRRQGAVAQHRFAGPEWAPVRQGAVAAACFSRHQRSSVASSLSLHVHKFTLVMAAACAQPSSGGAIGASQGGGHHSRSEAVLVQKFALLCFEVLHVQGPRKGGPWLPRQQLPRSAGQGLPSGILQLSPWPPRPVAPPAGAAASWPPPCTRQRP